MKWCLEKKSEIKLTKPVAINRHQHKLMGWMRGSLTYYKQFSIFRYLLCQRHKGTTIVMEFQIEEKKPKKNHNNWNSWKINSFNLLFRMTKNKRRKKKKLNIHVLTIFMTKAKEAKELPAKLNEPIQKSWTNNIKSFGEFPWHKSKELKDFEGQ